ncbi:MAG: SufBD protein [candidate division Zixibacteria bacterium]|nr:SufBD protein [candidate division Zixibacteria bacterium]
MRTEINSADELYKNIDTPHTFRDPDAAHLTINHDKVIEMHSVSGLIVNTEEIEDGIEVKMHLEDNTVIEKDVHLCFGMLPEKGIQRIVMEVNIGDNSNISLLAHCIFPFAVDVQHLMDAEINIGEGSSYKYYERHVHSPQGGVKVVPKALVNVAKGAEFRTEFELIKGRVGSIDIDYETNCDADSIVEMVARISGREDDIIKLKEIAHLNGENSRGVLTSKIAVRDSARAEIYNKLTASAAYARGHVDCKEIVQDHAVATALPIVEVHHPKAHITHEAALGSVDNKQLDTLMSRGLSEDDAVELIIDGLLGE